MRNGIDYYPTSCILEDSYKIINARFGAAGIGVLDFLFRRIYGVEGYFCKWSRDLTYIFCSEHSFDPDFVAEFVGELIERDFFSKEKYEKYGILTSAQIQQNFLAAVKRRKQVNIVEEYFLKENLTNSAYVNIFLKNVNPNAENVDTGEQSRVEESRVIKSRGERSTAEAETPSSRNAKVPFGTTAPLERENFNFDKVAEDFNRICSMLPPVQKLSGRRREKLLGTYPIVKDSGGFEKLFEKVSASGFLCGKNNRNWVATFDWIIDPNNALKIMEGQFADKNSTSDIHQKSKPDIHKQGSFDTSEFFAAALKRSMAESAKLKA